MSVANGVTANRRMAYFVGSLKVALAPNFAMSRTVSAARRAVILLLLYVVGASIGGVETGYWLAIGGIFGGVLDRGDTSVRVAAIAGLQFAVAVLGVGFLFGLWAPNQAVAFLFVIGCAALGGFASAISLSLARVLSYTAVMSVIGLFAASADASVIRWEFGLIALGILAQDLGIWLALAMDTDVIERRRVAQAVEEIAVSLEATADSQVTSVENSGKTAAALAVAETVLTTWDLPVERRERYLAILDAAQACRLEAISSAYRHSRELPTAASREVHLAAAAVLRGCAQALHGRLRSRARKEEVRRCVAVLGEVSSAEDPADRLLIENSTAVGTRTLDALTVKRFPRVRVTRARPIPDSVRSGLHWDQAPMSHGARMACAAAVSCVVAAVIGTPHVAWIAMTAIVVLRPDIASTSVRTISRAGGTFVGACGVLVIVLLIGQSTTALLIVGAVLACFAFGLMLVNYAYWVALILSVLIMLEAAVSSEPEVATVERVVDVIIGCLIALAVSWLIPVWRTPSVPGALARYANATSVWLEGLATALASGQADDSLRTTQVLNMRSTATAARAALGTSKAEPAHTYVDLAFAHWLEAAITEVVRTGYAALAPLLERGSPAPGSAAQIKAASRDLEFVAAAIVDSAPKLVPARDSVGLPGRTEAAGLSGGEPKLAMSAQLHSESEIADLAVSIRSQASEIRSALAEVARP